MWGREGAAAAVVKRAMQAAALALDDDGRVESAEVRGRRRGSGFSKVMASLRRLPIAENASASVNTGLCPADFRDGFWSGFGVLRAPVTLSFIR